VALPGFASWHKVTFHQSGVVAVQYPEERRNFILKRTQAACTTYENSLERLSAVIRQRLASGLHISSGRNRPNSMSAGKRYAGSTKSTCSVVSSVAFAKRHADRRNYP